MTRERELLARVLTSELWSVQEELQAEIKQLLAQPEQEPVAWIMHNKETGYRVQAAYRPTDLDEESCNVIPLYTSPKRERLSDEEVRAKYRDIALDNPLYVPSYYAGFRDAEKEHGIGGGND